ncbi:carbohydrate kinase family protein [Nocardioides sp. ChNu-153]|uniref:carbohydrate kinase family protein n=1 Tax=unclassified Nocardioides TaxID=2615069 RepID=UPI002405742A|nr:MULTISPECIES: carbohydrate kinase family protein [unclassified Nocardioides]MDF9715945.1 carbohydrate kinase family protein [Nocardioides sp. ChNu-99]MDN7122938.1 carbohydrate kinase family protein [Nocardioides sp. ChNu-153]
MSLLITGSIATDHLMTFSGKFADSLVVDQLDKLSVSFLVDDLDVRRGGCAANISFGLGNLGLRPILVGAVGEDFADYRSWLERHGVDCDSVHVSDTRHTARFVCTNDAAMAQFATFYAGAMSEAREIELQPIVERVGAPDYVLVGPNDPAAMQRHTDECRQRGYRFVADPSQQLAFGDGDLIRPLVDGADILFSNEYEAALIVSKTGWTHEEVLERVGTWVITLGPDGVRLEQEGAEPVVVGAVPEIAKVEPTGVGDAFRAGFLAALSWDLEHERAAQVGCLLAVYVVEQVGTQEYTLGRAAFLERLEGTYGPEAVAEVEPHLQTFRP